MSWKERLKKWTLSMAEEGVAETVTEIAIDQLPPVMALSILIYLALLVSIIFGAAGWYFESYETLLYVLAGVAGSVSLLLYGLRLYVISKLSNVLLKGYRYAKDRTLTKPDSRTAPKEPPTGETFEK